MKTALITSTIHVPEVLRLYRACSPGAQWGMEDQTSPRFFVAIDQKTPEAAVNLCQYDIPNTRVCFLQEQEQYACSKLIGWNTVERRNIALLEALKWGAEIIVTVDDDNLPMSTDYFDRFEKILSEPFNGLAGGTVDNWFDPGCLIQPHTRHRGFPTTIDATPYFFGPVVGAKVGVAAGLVLGDPDISAVDRISQKPLVQNVSQIAHGGIVVLPGIHTVMNTQNTAFLRELAPCFLTCPQFGRFADIFASLICQRVMRETGHVVHFGMPFVWQQRNPHNLIDDLKAEIWGLEHIQEFANWLAHIHLNDASSVVDHVRTIYGQMKELTWMPAGVSELGLVWADDIDKVMS